MELQLLLNGGKYFSGAIKDLQNGYVNDKNSFLVLEGNYTN